MWNALVSGAAGRRGDRDDRRRPGVPGPRAGSGGWPSETGATLMGASPGFVMACRAAGVDLSRPRPADPRGRLGRARRCRPRATPGSASSSAPDVQLNVGSGGTDVCSGLVQNNPLLPVRAGMISGRALGVDVHAFDEDGQRGDRRARRARGHRARCRRCRSACGATTDGSRLRDDLLRPLPRRLAARRLDRLRAGRQLRGHRPQRRHPQPRRRAARHRRVLPRRRGAARASPTAWSSTWRTRPAATAS